MRFSNNQIAEMSFEDLKRVKLAVSKVLNSRNTSKEIVAAEILRDAIDRREDTLESIYCKVAKMTGKTLRTCTQCDKIKPVENHPYGFKFIRGRVSTVCKRCDRDNTRDHHARNLDQGRLRASINQTIRQPLGKITKYDRQRIRDAQKDKCAYCGVELSGKGHLDHYDPVDKGGDNLAGNRVWACATCNHNKYEKTPGEFLTWMKSHQQKVRRGGFFDPKNFSKVQKS